MLHKPLLTLILTLLATTAGASDLLTPVTLNQQAPDQYTEWKLLLSEQDKPWFTYYGADNKLYVHRPSGDEISFGATDRKHEQSGLAMTKTDDGQVALFWRDKQPRKTLFLAPNIAPSGAAPTPLSIDGADSEPLPALEIARDANNTYLLWLGEKGDPDQEETYHIYFGSLGADGKTLSKVEQVLPGLYPAWIVDEKRIPIFSRVEGENPAIAMRVFDREQQTFTASKKIADPPPILNVIFQAFKSDKRWFVIWLGHYDGKNLLEGVYSDDQGETWKRFAFEDLRGINQGLINIATDHKGHIFITLDGNWRFTDPEDTKSNIYVVRSSDNGTTWEKAQKLRAEDQKYTKGQYPMVAIGKEPGTVMLAWEDWRDIRPNVYVSYSKDYGATWEAALPLGRPGIWNLGLNPLSRSLVAGTDGRFRLVASQYSDTSSKSARDLVMYTFNWDELKRSAATFTAVQGSEEVLRKRMSDYWQAMVDGKYEVSYAFMDPFFRDARNLKNYQDGMGMVQYHSYQFGRIAIKGNLAKVALRVEGSVPELTMPSGKKTSQPRKPITFVDTWVFVNGNWYREYYDSLNESSFTRY